MYFASQSSLECETVSKIPKILYKKRKCVEAEPRAFPVFKGVRKTEGQFARGFIYPWIQSNSAKALNLTRKVTALDHSSWMVSSLPCDELCFMVSGHTNSCSI